MKGPSLSVSRITAFLDRGISRTVTDALREVGVEDYARIAGRGIVREERSGILSLLPGKDISEDPLDIISFLVSPQDSSKALSLVIEKAGLEMPGRGSVMSEELRLLKSFPPLAVKPLEVSEGAEAIKSPGLMTGICCIVQQGQGNRVGRIALDTGVCVPSIILGYGTGVRDKMGLLRIAIPAQKEIISFIAARHDAETVMELMIDVGKLDQPGKGFIYSFPVRHGLPNIKVSRGDRQHAAGIDQIVAAIDQMRGGPEWRQRSNALARNGQRRRGLLAGLTDMILLCEEGYATRLIKAAMDAGAGGATVSRFKQATRSDSDQERRAGSREICRVGENMIEKILDALEEAGAFTEECRAQVFTRPIEKAFTYIRKK